MQTRLGSFVEAWVNIFVGIGIAYTANITVLPAIGVPISHSQNIVITLVMTVLSLVRSYLLRRLFNKLRLFTYAARNVQEKKVEGTEGRKGVDTAERFESEYRG